MVERIHEPKREEKLTSPTNQQEFPAEQTQDTPGQADNRRRVQAAKEADAERLARVAAKTARKAEKAEEKSATLRNGTKVRAEAEVIDGLTSGEKS